MNNIAIFGLGAIGSNLAVQLSKQYSSAIIHGYDFDRVEDRNIKTQAYFLEHVGQYKSQSLLAVLARSTRGIKYHPYLAEIATKKDIETCVSDFKPNDLIIDCFDNFKSRNLFKGIKHNILHIGFSPQFSAEIIWNESYSSPNDIAKDAPDICSLDNATSFIQFVVSFAAMIIVEFVNDKRKRNFIITGKYKIRELWKNYDRWSNGYGCYLLL